MSAKSALFNRIAGRRIGTVYDQPGVRRDELFVRKRYGDTNCVELNQMLTKNIRVSIDRLSVDVENCKFARKEPPEEYTMVQLWMNIFPYIHRKLEDFEV